MSFTKNHCHNIAKENIFDLILILILEPIVIDI